MTSSPSELSVQRVTKEFDGLFAYYGTTVVNDAARALDALLATAAEFGVEGEHGYLLRAVTEAAPRKLSRPLRATPLPSTRLYELAAALRDEFKEAGLTETPSLGQHGGVQVAVDPLPDGPTFGVHHRGLCVTLFTDGVWTLTINQNGSTVMDIYAPMTPEGARDVAAVVRGILDGTQPNKFARRT